MQYPFISILVLMSLFSLNLTAQCDFSVFEEAQRQYNFGEFKPARDALIDCAENFESETTNNKALRLLALIAIAED